jgi:hypothetical protein
MVGLAGGADQMRQVEGRKCWNLVHVAHLVNSKARTNSPVLPRQGGVALLKYGSLLS